jgi:hypothetical protein
MLPLKLANFKKGARFEVKNSAKALIKNTSLDSPRNATINLRDSKLMKRFVNGAVIYTCLIVASPVGLLQFLSLFPSLPGHLTSCSATETSHIPLINPPFPDLWQFFGSTLLLSSRLSSFSSLSLPSVLEFFCPKIWQLLPPSKRSVLLLKRHPIQALLTQARSARSHSMYWSKVFPSQPLRSTPRCRILPPFLNETPGFAEGLIQKWRASILEHS